MSKPKPSRYRTTHWSACNKALRKCGSLLIWLDKEMAWHAPHEGRPARPPILSNAAIQFCQSIKALLKRPLMQSEPAWRHRLTAQGSSGHGHRHLRHPRAGVHSQPGS